MSTRKHSEEARELALLTQKVIPKFKQPHMYKVFLINDDFTPMGFVVAVLMMFFQMSEPVANITMLKVHTQGKALCGIYTKDVADTKVQMVIDYARANQYPLLCQMEKV